MAPIGFALWFFAIFLVKVLALLSIDRERWQRSLVLALITSALWLLLFGLGNVWLFVIFALFTDYMAIVWLFATHLRDAIRRTIVWELYVLGYGSILAIVVVFVAGRFLFPA